VYAHSLADFYEPKYNFEVTPKKENLNFELNQPKTRLYSKNNKN